MDKTTKQYGTVSMRNFDINALLIKVLGLTLIAMAPIKAALIAITILVFGDGVTGLWASLQEGKKITSDGFRRTINKLLVYWSLLVVSLIMEVYLLDGIPVVKVITGFVGMIECKSFFENIHRITGVDYWSMILSKIPLPNSKAGDSNKDAPK